MKTLIILLFLSVTASAQDMSALLKGMKVDQAQVKLMVDKMERSGKISKSDADKARKELTVMTPKQMEEMNAKALKVIEKSGALKNPQDLDLGDTMKNLKEAEKMLESN